MPDSARKRRKHSAAEVMLLKVAEIAAPHMPTRGTSARQASALTLNVITAIRVTMRGCPSWTVKKVCNTAKPDNPRTPGSSTTSSPETSSALSQDAR